MALKGTTIESVHIDVTAFKHKDTTVDFHINLTNIYGKPVRPGTDHTFTAKVANKTGYVSDFPCKVSGVSLIIDSEEFFNLPPDHYYMEVWETWTNAQGKQETAIYPSPTKTLEFDINENIEDKTGEIVKKFDFQEAVENTVKDFLKNHPGSGDVDLRDYAKKSDIQRQLEDYAKKTDLPKEPDLSGYETKQEASDTFATKAEVPSVEGLAKESDIPKVILDVAKRTLTINGQTVDIPGNVDLSHFYTKDEVDKKLTDIASGGKVDLTGYLTKVAADDSYLAKNTITLDTDKRVLKLGGQTISIPNSVDLSGYLTKNDAEGTYAKKSDLPSLDDYAKKEDVPSIDGLAKESEIPQIKLDTAARTLTLGEATINIPNTVDLSGYATKAELPKVSINSETRTVTINGQSISIPASVDLSGYYTKDEVDTKISQSNPNLTPYLKTADADKKYAEKAALDSYLTQAEASTTYATKQQLPVVPDMSQYAKKSDIPSINGLAKETELSNYATSASVAEVESTATAAMDKAASALEMASKASSGATIDYDKLYDGFADKIMTMKF